MDEVNGDCTKCPKISLCEKPCLRARRRDDKIYKEMITRLIEDNIKNKERENGIY